MDTFGRFSPISVDIFEDACGCFGFCFTRRVRLFTRHYCHRILGFFNEVEDDGKKGAVRMECLRDINRSFFCIFNLVEVVLGIVEVFAVLNVIFLFFPLSFSSKNASLLKLRLEMKDSVDSLRFFVAEVSF